MRETELIKRIRQNRNSNGKEKRRGEENGKIEGGDRNGSERGSRSDGDERIDWSIGDTNRRVIYIA